MTLCDFYAGVWQVLEMRQLRPFRREWVRGGRRAAVCRVQRPEEEGKLLPTLFGRLRRQRLRDTDDGVLDLRRLGPRQVRARQRGKVPDTQLLA